MTSKATDQEYLKNEQYRDASHLNARIALHRRYGTSAIGWQRWVFDQLDLPAYCRILELGCGPGQLWAQNEDRLPPGWQITLSDFSFGMLAQARENLALDRHPFHFIQCDAQAIPCRDGYFDVVVANHMLYHVPDRTRTYTEVRRVLKPGGRFVAATNGRENMRQLKELERGLGLEEFTVWNGAFDLEAGEIELRRWFAHVTLRRHEETLVVTEAEPLIAYILSGVVALTDEKRETLRQTAFAEITAKSAFRIDKIAGLFIAEA